MTGSKVLLDTNIVSALLKGEISIADKIDNAEEVFIPIIVLAELYYGAQYSAKVEENIRNIKKVAQRYEILNINQETAYLYGIIKTSLRKKGKPIPENDIWIGTIAKQFELTLITRDKHFNEIDGMSIDNW